MQIDYNQILKDLLAIGEDALLQNIEQLKDSGADYVTNLLDRLKLVAEDYKERKDWGFVKARISDEAKIFVAEVRSVEVLEEATAERVINSVISWATGYVTSNVLV